MTLNEMETKILILEKEVARLSRILENREMHSAGRKKKLTTEEHYQIVKLIDEGITYREMIIPIIKC